MTLLEWRVGPVLYLFRSSFKEREGELKVSVAFSRDTLSLGNGRFHLFCRLQLPIFIIVSADIVNNFSQRNIWTGAVIDML